MPPKKKEKEKPTTCDKATEPEPLFDSDLLDIDGRLLLLQFEGMPGKMKVALNALKEQHTTGAPKTIKDDVVEKLEHLLDWMQEFRKMLITASTVSARLASIEQKLNEIKGQTTSLASIELDTQTIKAQTTNLPPAQTWAQIASANVSTTTTDTANEVAHERAHKRQLQEKLRQERAKYEVTLTAQSVSEEMKKEMDKMHATEITKRCQHAIEKSEMFNSSERPKLNGINRLSNNGIRLQCQSPEEADQLHKINWNVAFEGLRIHKPNYGITVHGVPKTDINFNDETDLKEIIRKLEKANASRGIPINKIAPLRRKPQTDGKPSKNHSIVVFTEDLDAANTCIRMGFYINHQRYLAEKYAPQFHLTQCYKCFDYGHRASHCKRKQKCGKCGENHPNIDSCQSTEARCTSCNGNHHPWSFECPERRAESRRLRALRLQMNPLFS